MLWQECFECYRAGRRDLLVFVGRDLDLRRLLLAVSKTSNDAPRKTLQYFVFLLCRHAKKYDNAITEEHDKQTSFDTEGQGSCRHNLVTLEPGGVDTIAQ
jgi:hypothetical protein